MSLNQTYKTLFQPLDLFHQRQIVSDVSAGVHRRQRPALDALLDDVHGDVTNAQDLRLAEWNAVPPSAELQAKQNAQARDIYSDDEDETCDSNGKA